MSIKTDSSGVLQLTPSMRRGIEMLSVAYGYAREVGRDDWEFALEIQSLAAAGVNNSELRWLVCMGLIRHAQEKFGEGDGTRLFHAIGDVAFSNHSCFILTDSGYDLHQQYAHSGSNSPIERSVLAYRTFDQDAS